MDRKDRNIYRRVKNRYTGMGIKNKTLLMVSFVIIVALFLFIYIFVSVFNTKSEKENIGYSKKILNNIKTNLDTYFDEISAVANQTNYEYYLQNYLIEQKNSDTSFTGMSRSDSMENYQMSAELFDATLNNRSDVTSIMIFNEKNLLLHNTIFSYVYDIKDYTNEEWYRSAVENPKQAIITGPRFHDFLIGNKNKTISLSQAISSYEDGSLLGVILIDLNSNEISEICDAVYLSSEGSLCLINRKGELVYERNQMTDGKASLKIPQNLEALNRPLLNKSKTDFFVTLNNERYQVVYSYLEKADWYIVSITPYSNFTKTMYGTLWLVIAVVIALLVLIILVLNTLLTNIIQPIVILKEHMDLADKGRLDVRVECNRKDETGMLSRSFNNMLERIERLMKQVVKEQEDKRKYELQALQAQINPHFLYNTLEAIIWMAETNNPDIVKMTESLARLFRIALNKGNEFISVELELEHVKNYLMIESIRFMDKFEYTIEIEDEVRKCKTVKLIVQPIVENCIYHGIKKKEKGMIRITAGKHGEHLVITISDNGYGMSEEMCRDILKSKAVFSNSNGSGIGVKNVNERIRLYFGSEYGITYNSTVGEGTIATITLPMITEEVHDVKSIQEKT